MGNLHLVTGHAGVAHVTAADHASLNVAIFGEGQHVLNRGSKFATTIISNNSIRVADGDIIMQGRHIRLNEGTYVDLTIENGTQGKFRNDLIVARYTKDSLTGVEDCNLVVIKGTESTGSAVDPEYTSGDIINDHVLLADMPLYRVPLDGLNVNSLECLFDVYSSVMGTYASAKGSASSLTLPVEKITELTLDTWITNSNQFTFSGGGMVMPFDGVVLVCASVYFDSAKMAAPQNLGVYAKKNGTEIAGQLTYCAAKTTCQLSPFITTVEKGDIITLCGRSTTGNGVCIPNAQATALTVIYL